MLSQAGVGAISHQIYV